jgi:hypothetical protein
MTLYEGLTIAVIVVLGLATTAAIYVGLLNWMGAAFVVRCAVCHHLTFASVNQPRESCAHCRHPALLHPLYSAGHPGAVRVVGDSLRY